jgi:hypothetical protein
MTLEVGELTYTGPTAEERVQEREERNRQKQSSVNRLRSSLSRPKSFQDALSGMEESLREIGRRWKIPPLDFERTWREVHSESEPKKIELKIRKAINEARKFLSDRKHLLEYLSLCTAHGRFLAENPSSTWKVIPSLKRLATQLKHTDFLPAVIGFILALADEVESKVPETAQMCREVADEAFAWLNAAIEEKANYESGLAELPSLVSVDDRHFRLYYLIEYLDMRREYDPSVREQLVKLCEDDIKLYRAFLKDSGGVCPNLPSFNALYGLFSEEGNKTELLRLQKLAKRIHYDYGDDFEEDASAESTQGITQKPADII